MEEFSCIPRIIKLVTEPPLLAVILLVNPLSLSSAREPPIPGTKCNGEAIAIGIGGTDASGHAKTVGREGSDYSGDYSGGDGGDDGGNDGLPQSVEPAKQRVLTTLQQSPGSWQSRKAKLYISSASRGRARAAFEPSRLLPWGKEKSWK